MKKTLVTGGAGFIGSHLVEALVRRGDDVVVLDDLSTGAAANLEAVAERIRLAVGDVADTTLLADVLAGVDTVFHLAALTSVTESVEDPEAFHRVDAGGTLAVLSAARAAGVRRFVLAGSCAAYGEGGEIPATETDPVDPLSPYAAAKLAAEAYAKAYRNAFGLEAVTLRFFNVYGPRQRADAAYAAVVPRFLDALLSKERPTVFGSGEQTRDLVFVEDVVSACLAASDVEALSSPVLNVASGRSVSVLEVLEACGAALGVVPDPVFEPARPGDILHSRADVTRLAEVLGFRASISLKEGIRRTADRARNG